MFPRILAVLLALLLAPAAMQADSAGRRSIVEILRKVQSEAGLPALAAAVVRSNEVIAAAAIGVRKAGETEKVTLADKFHIGSVTKPMTATLAAMLVEQGKLAWTNTLADCFPDWSGLIHDDYLPVTVEQLLSHQAGLPGDLTKTKTWQHVWARSARPAIEQRAALAKELLGSRPELPPGTKYVYANAGYTIAGLILERKEKKDWEELIRERLFEPLNMKSAGFGAPATAGKVDQPWGHVLRRGQVVSIPPGPAADNPAAIGPGGTVHCSVLDLAAFANLHLQGARGSARLLTAETFRRLHTPADGQTYSLGWGVAKRAWAKGRALNHMGSNTMNTAIVWIAPEIDFAMVIVTNLGGKEAEKACDDLAGKLIAEFLK